MDSQPWLRSTEAVVRQGLPPSLHSAIHGRTVRSFSRYHGGNHGHGSHCVVSVGRTDEVAEAAVRAYRRRSFLGRHHVAAFLVFGVSPVVSQIVLFIVSVLGIRAVVMIADRVGASSDHGNYVAPSPRAVDAISYLFDLIFIVVPSILIGVLYCKLAKRSGIGKKWALISCTVLAAMAMLPCWYVALGADAAGHARAFAGLSIPFRRTGWSGYCSNTLELLEPAIPVAIGWWFCGGSATHAARASRH